MESLCILKPVTCIPRYRFNSIFRCEFIYLICNQLSKLTHSYYLQVFGWTQIIYFIGESRGAVGVATLPLVGKCWPKQVIFPFSGHTSPLCGPNGEKYSPDWMQSQLSKLLYPPMQFTHYLLQQKHITHIHNVVRIKLAWFNSSALPYSFIIITPSSIKTPVTFWIIELDR